MKSPIAVFSRLSFPAVIPASLPRLFASFLSLSRHLAKEISKWLRWMLVFALLLGLTSGLRVVPDNLHATFAQGLNSILVHGPAIDWQSLSGFGLASAAMSLPLRIVFTDMGLLSEGNPEEAVWSLDRALEIHTSPESNLAGTEVTVRVPGLRWKLEN